MGRISYIAIIVLAVMLAAGTAYAGDCGKCAPKKSCNSCEVKCKPVCKTDCTPKCKQTCKPKCSPKVECCEPKECKKFGRKPVIGGPSKPIDPCCCPPGDFELIKCCMPGEFELLCQPECESECKPKCKQDTCSPKKDCGCR